MFDPAFDRDEANISDISAHGVIPSEAEEVILNDPVDLDFQIRDGEERIRQIGRTNAGRMLAVVTPERRGLLRVITGYAATQLQERIYLLAKGRGFNG